MIALAKRWPMRAKSKRLGIHMRAIVLASVMASLFSVEAALAASVSKTYAYFSISGRTSEQLERSLLRRGPKVNGSREGHPGATELGFAGNVEYKSENGKCRVGGATYHVKAKIILPRLRRIPADADTQLYWKTLTQDIRRHEESHVIIAKNYARKLEQQLKSIRPAADCKTVEAKVAKMTDKVMAEHDAAQTSFDRIEGKSFERRMMRLLDYNLSRRDK